MMYLPAQQIRRNAMQTTNENIFNVLSKLVEESKGKFLTWSQFVAAINKSGMQITNWLKVRGVLQFMINENMIERRQDIHVEEYLCK
jgi:hypothetical protein